jgi:hypothetical protein
MERSSDLLRQLLAQYSEVLANLSGALAVPAEQDPPQAEQGLGLPAGGGNDEPPASASSLRPQRRRPQRPTGAQPGDGEPVEVPEARKHASQASGEDPGPPASNLSAVNGGEGRPPSLAVPDEQDPPQAEQGLGLPAGRRNDEPPASASSLGPQRRRPQRPTGAQPGDGETVEAPEARKHASQASGEDRGPPASSLPAVNGGEGRPPSLPAFDQRRIATIRGQILGIEETAEAIQAVACELRALSERIGCASQPTGRERLAGGEQAQSLRDLLIVIAEEATAAARLAAISR